MTVLHLEQKNKLQQAYILHISELVASAIEIKGSIKTAKAVDSKESILDSLAKMLEMMLTLDINLTKERKLEAIHLLTKLKANKEYMQLIKGNITGQTEAFSQLHEASGRMFNKSQSAFGND